MAVLGKIRSKGSLLVGVIALGLFSFIAEEAFRSCETTRNESRQQVGEVLGKKISVQDYQALIDEYQSVLKMTQGIENLSDEQLNQVKDQVWQQYVNEKLIAAEAEKLGLTVTDAEIADVIAQGTNQMLLQTPFVNQQTGRFDAQSLKKFLADYKKFDKASNPQIAEQYEQIYNYWKFIEKSLKSSLLMQKYQGLLAGCMLSNPVSAKMSFEGRSNEKSVQLASLAYSTVNDNDIKVEDSQLKAKYEELKEMFRQYEETRSVKYVSYRVTASAADRKALEKQVADAVAQLQNGDDAADVVRKAQSLVSYAGMAVSAKALPSDIAAKLDSLAVGQVKNLGENRMDNTLNAVKLIAKIQQPDSVEYRQIQIGGTDIAVVRKTADSIYTALQGGADFEALAKKYNQTGQKIWLTSNMYEGANGLDEDSKKLLSALLNGGVNATQNVEFAQGNSIVQVTDRRNIINKYDVAVIKKSIDFSKDTYSAAYNKFSEFVSKCSDEKSLVENAKKYNFSVVDGELSTSQHYVAGLRATREALKWAFDADKGDLSPLYECGNNDNLLVLVLTDVHPQGYRSLDDEQVKTIVKAEVVKDLKFEKLSAKLNGVKNIAEAKAKGANISEVNQVTFSVPVFVSATGASESALAGAIAATKKGQFSSHVVKGNAGAYVFQVVDQKKSAAKFKAKEEEQRLSQRAIQAASRYSQELYVNGKVVDNRYLFF